MPTLSSSAGVAMRAQLQKGFCSFGWQQPWHRGTNKQVILHERNLKL